MSFSVCFRAIRGSKQSVFAMVSSERVPKKWSGFFYCHSFGKESCYVCVCWALLFDLLSSLDSTPMSETTEETVLHVSIINDGHIYLILLYNFCCTQFLIWKPDILRMMRKKNANPLKGWRDGDEADEVGSRSSSTTKWQRIECSWATEEDVEMKMVIATHTHTHTHTSYQITFIIWCGTQCHHFKVTANIFFSLLLILSLCSFFFLSVTMRSHPFAFVPVVLATGNKKRPKESCSTILL